MNTSALQALLRVAYVLLAAGLPPTMHAQTVDDIDLPEPPAGFAWQKLPEIRAAFLLPDGWHYKQERKDGTLDFFLTQEDIDETGLFQTGLTINAIRDAKKRTGRKASRYAEEFIATWVATNERLDAWTTTVGDLEGFGGRIRAVQEGQVVIIHGLGIGNKKTDMLYILFFESPESTWEGAWDEFGSKMLQLFFLDDEV